MNRDFPLTDGKDNTTLFAECSHCGEPLAIIGKIPTSLAQKDETQLKCFCRGSSGLSIYTRCCVVLKCAEKKGNWCDFKPVPPGKEYPVNKQWNTIVEETHNG